MKHYSFLARMTTVILASFPLLTQAQSLSSDTLIRRQLEAEGIHFSCDNKVKLLMSGQAKFDDMFAEIRKARHSIHLEYFNFRNDSIASLLFDLLRQKRSEGVEVRALFDGFGNDSNNQPLKKHHIKSLRDDSVNIHEFDPIRFPWVNHIWPRDHRKIVVIDGRVAYTGGMNVADYYIKGTEQVGEWRDMHCRLEGSAINDLQDIFMRIWKKTTDETLSGDSYFFHPTPDSLPGHATVGIINREPHTSNRIMRTFYVSAIDDARDSIRIINPYLTLIPSVKRAMKRAIKRGVKLEIMVSAKSDIPMTPNVVFYNVRKLQKQGATVWLYQPGFHHSKIMMVDGRFCTVGSTNLDARSLRFDYEENAVILNRDVTRQLDQMFDRDKKSSRLLTDEYWHDLESPWQRFVGWFGHLLGPFL